MKTCLGLAAIGACGCEVWVCKKVRVCESGCGCR